MRKHNQIHTLGAPHYKAHFRFLRKLNTVVALICSQVIISLPRTQKPVSECYVIQRFTGTIVEWYEYCALLDAVGGLRIGRVHRICVN